MKRVRFHIECANCGKKVTSNKKNKKYCDDRRCKDTAARKAMELDILEEGMSRSNIGAFSESYAIAYFMSRGYLVYDHKGTNSPFDIVLYKDKKFTKVEIKSGRKNPDTEKLYYTKPTKSDYDILCVVCVTDASIHIIKKKDV